MRSSYRPNDPVGWLAKPRHSPTRIQWHPSCRYVMSIAMTEGNCSDLEGPVLCASLVRKHVPDSDPGWPAPVESLQRNM